jgi:CheY-like chemotaxis protein
MNARIADSLAPKARRVFLALQTEIQSGALPPGTKLPANNELATRHGVSAVTMRNVLNRLQDAGLVSVEHGRGTFVRSSRAPAVLIVEDEENHRIILRTHVEKEGYDVIEAASPAEAVEALEDSQPIAMVFSDVRLPSPEAGVDFIRTVRRRWPGVPLVAVTAYAADLEALHGTPDCPILILSKPIRGQHIAEALSMALSSKQRPF